MTIAASAWILFKSSCELKTLTSFAIIQTQLTNGALCCGLYVKKCFSLCIQYVYRSFLTSNSHCVPRVCKVISVLAQLQQKVIRLVNLFSPTHYVYSRDKWNFPCNYPVFWDYSHHCLFSNSSCWPTRQLLSLYM